MLVFVMTLLIVFSTVFTVTIVNLNVLVSDHVLINQAVQLKKMARGLKFWILEVEGLYYLCSENKGADQLRGYREADLRLCFCICKTFVFS